MVMLLSVIISISLLALAVYAGYRFKEYEGTAALPPLSRDYLAGINFIINDETDKAVDLFIKLLAVDSDTVETHLALGKLFRRRGEVDRAIRIHQNLIARPQLGTHQRDQSYFELGCDYLSIGMLDRAERIFMEMSPDPHLGELALKQLIDIYQQEKSWEKAIKTAENYENRTKKAMKATIAHYHSELAEQAIQRNALEDAILYAKQAYACDASSARANFILARIAMLQKRYQDAVTHLTAIPQQDPRYLQETLPLLSQAYQMLGQMDVLRPLLSKWVEQYPVGGMLKHYAEFLRVQDGVEVAAQYVKQQVKRRPTQAGVVLYLQLSLPLLHGQTKEDVKILLDMMQRLLAQSPQYQCSSCGFTANTLHWLCPGCKQWNTMPLLEWKDYAISG